MGYDVMSSKAEEFINDEEILETLDYAEKHKTDEKLILNILEEAALLVAKGNVLNINDTNARSRAINPGTDSVVLDGNNDTFLGDIALASGDLEMKDLRF